MRWRIFGCSILFLLILGHFPGYARPYTDLWQTVLSKYIVSTTKHNVTTTLVDYEHLKTDPTFKELILQLETYPLESLQTDPEKIAFWVNAYNITALRLIVLYYPVSGIEHIQEMVKSGWQINALQIGDEGYSLARIHYQILSKLEDPRIVFALACPALSCPDLRKEPYVPERLNRQLGEQTLSFLQNPTKGTAFIKGRTYVSKLFRWQEAEFEPYGGVAAFITWYLKKIIPKSPDFLNFDWRLNDTSSKPMPISSVPASSPKLPGQKATLPQPPLGSKSMESAVPPLEAPGFMDEDDPG